MTTLMDELAYRMAFLLAATSVILGVATQLH